MSEDFLHFIYKHKLWSNELILSSGKTFEVLDTGLQNYDSGPDFFNAKIKIDDKIWVGNVEIHINSSDWYKHKHHKDLSYNNVILHIVYSNDKDIEYANGEKIPTWEMRFKHVLYNKYSELKIIENPIPCSDYIELVDEFNIGMWLQRMSIDRLLKKVDYIDKLLPKYNNDWEQAFYISLARNFGFGTNAVPFEQLAFQTPVNIIRKYSDNIIKIEAILFGQSGLLPESHEDAYVKTLISEYKFLKHKYKLDPIRREIWKGSKMHPANFPCIRIAQFAGLLINFQGLFAKITEDIKLEDIHKYFMIKTSEYWESHYNFEKKSVSSCKNLGSSSINVLIINTIIPFKYHYSKNFKRNSISESFTIELLNEIKAENNREVRMWRSLNVIPNNAFESQALINLKKDYCDQKKCLDCSIGYEIMKKISKL